MNSSKQNKEQILMIVSRFPYPLDKGDKLRAYHQAKELNKHYSLTLFALTDHKISDKDIKEIEKICDHLIFFQLNWGSKILNMIGSFLKKKPFQVGYFYHSKAKKTINSLIEYNDFKHIYCQLLRTSEYCKNTHQIPKTIDYMDALSKGVERRIDSQPFYKKWVFKLEAKRLQQYERSIFDYFEFKTIISNQDKQLILHPDQEDILPIPNGIDASFFEYPTIEKQFDFVFVGNMSYPPNIEAVQYIAKNILPEIKNSTLLISGASPVQSVKDIANSSPNITLTGWVDDIRESYTKGRIFLAPMLIGTGMQNKLLEAMAMGIPCITTTLANNAIGATHKKEILVGNNQKEIIEMIQLLQNNGEFSSEIAHNGQKFVQEKFNWVKSVDELTKMWKKGN